MGTMPIASDRLLVYYLAFCNGLIIIFLIIKKIKNILSIFDLKIKHNVIGFCGRQSSTLSALAGQQSLKPDSIFLSLVGQPDSIALDLTGPSSIRSDWLAIIFY
jgi:hypothetical protein